MASCQNGPTRHAYAWQKGPFWQDTLALWTGFSLGVSRLPHHIWWWSRISRSCWVMGPWGLLILSGILQDKGEVGILFCVFRRPPPQHASCRQQKSTILFKVSITAAALFLRCPYWINRPWEIFNHRVLHFRHPSKFSSILLAEGNIYIEK